MTKFKNISLYEWRQFAHISIDFHPRLTIITGANGAGKSTILNICSQHFGYSQPFLATPRRKKGGGIRYDQGYYTYLSQSELTHYQFEDETEESNDEQDEDEDERQTELLLKNMSYEPSRRTSSIPEGHFVEIGSITYENGITTQIGFPEQQASAYGIQINSQQHVLGVPISSHRVVSNYQPVQGLSLQSISIETAYQNFFSEYVQRLNGGRTNFSPLYRMKETLITMAAFGEGNQHLEKNPQLSAAFDGFGAILRKVLPAELGFQKIIVRVPDIVLKTRSGEFILDASSGGVTAVIEIAWQLYLYSLTNKSFVVTMDEPENHLHPSMQRSILSNLISAFPLVQFVVATHSPFIVSAVEDSRVYALKYSGSVNQSGFPNQGPRRVHSIALDQTAKAGSASEILEEVLGVSVSIPEWAVKRLNHIIVEFEGAEVTKETLQRLRTRLADAGFSEYYPQALSRLVNE